MDLCEKGLHKRPDSAGKCQGCNSLRKKRVRSAKRGRPLCWTAEHAEPDEGLICPCGEPPPGPAWLDWVVSERVVQGLSAGRSPTAAEMACAVRTVQALGHVYDDGSDKDSAEDGTVVTVADAIALLRQRNPDVLPSDSTVYQAVKDWESLTVEEAIMRDWERVPPIGEVA